MEELTYLIEKAITDITYEEYPLRGDEQLYNRISGVLYNTGLLYNTDIRNGTELVYV